MISYFLRYILLIISLCIFSVPFCLSQKTTTLQRFPKHWSPEEIGKRVAVNFIATPHTNFGRPTPPKVITYPEACTWYGALRFADRTYDKDLLNDLVSRFDPLFGPEAFLIPTPDHVDFAIFGIVPLELYIQTKDPRYLAIGEIIADKQWLLPEEKLLKSRQQELYDLGYSWMSRMWIDDMYMISSLQSQAYRATGDEKYITRAAKEMLWYLDSLQRPNGLFFHAPDVPFFWGRGNGWMAAGMSELLYSLPKENSYYAPILKGYIKMMSALVKYQTNDGLWRQLIDDKNSWKETSGSGMFAYALIMGVKNGWLESRSYARAARKAWLGLVKHIDEKGNIREVCEGTNKKNDRQYYLNRKRQTGDLHGQAPLLWCAAALL